MTLRLPVIIIWSTFGKCKYGVHFTESCVSTIIPELPQKLLRLVELSNFDSYKSFFIS